MPEQQKRGASRRDAVGALIFQAQREMAFVRKQEQTPGNAPTASLLDLSLRALFWRKICSQHCYSCKILAAQKCLIYARCRTALPVNCLCSKRCATSPISCQEAS